MHYIIMTLTVLVMWCPALYFYTIVSLGMQHVTVNIMHAVAIVVCFFQIYACTYTYTALQPHLGNNPVQ